jgi:hypothetical protein
LRVASDNAPSVRRQFVEHHGIVRRIDDHRDAIVVLGRGSHHRRTADIDVLDGILVTAARLRDRRCERIEIDDQQIDRLDAVLAHDRVVDIASAEQTAVNLRMQRLDAAIHDFGKARVAGNLRDRHAGALEQRRGAAGGEHCYAALVQRLRELEETVFVRNAEQRAANGHCPRP